MSVQSVDGYSDGRQLPIILQGLTSISDNYTFLKIYGSEKVGQCHHQLTTMLSTILAVS